LSLGWCSPSKSTHRWIWRYRLKVGTSAFQHQQNMSRHPSVAATAAG
jgi:hypothetical protein